MLGQMQSLSNMSYLFTIIKSPGWVFWVCFFPPIEISLMSNSVNLKQTNEKSHNFLMSMSTKVKNLK